MAMISRRRRHVPSRSGDDAHEAGQIPEDEIEEEDMETTRKIKHRRHHPFGLPSSTRPILALLCASMIAFAMYHRSRRRPDDRPRLAVASLLRKEAVKDRPRCDTVARNGSMGQCIDACLLFPPGVPVSPGKVSNRDARNRDLSPDSVRVDWKGAVDSGALGGYMAWFQLAMPNTGTTSMDGYMGLGANMTPLQRAGGCERACVRRVRPALESLLDGRLWDRLGLDSAPIQKCHAEAFRRMSAVARCELSGGHSDYSQLKRNGGSCSSRWSKENDRVIFGTTLREPIAYHHKLFLGVSAMFDPQVCELWASTQLNQTDVSITAVEDLSSEKNRTFGFFCFKDRKTWKIGSDFNSYMNFAHHRWNIFTRNLAGTIGPSHTPIMSESDLRAMHSKRFTRKQAVEQNYLGKKSPDYIAAVSHLEAMPHFSIFERMVESIELLCFTYCYNCTALGFSYKPHKRPPVPDEVRAATSQFHKLDLLLYDHANQVFTRRVNWMREAKADGVQCDLLLSGCGLSCDL